MKTPGYIPLSILFILMLGSTALIAQTKTSLATGNWTEIHWNPTGLPTRVNDVHLSHTVTIREGTTVEINNLNIGSNGSLIVNGILKVNGNITMDNNGSQFIMGPNAIVVVNGSFLASNRIDISISGHLIIQGDFIKAGATVQGDFTITGAKIYVLGTASGWPNFTSCSETYSGTTNTTADNCDYGNQQDFLNNYSSFPPAVQQQLNCFQISHIPSVTTCPNFSVSFSISAITNVTYEWQVLVPGGRWTSTGITTRTLNIPNVTTAMNGNNYRVVVRSTVTTINCKIAVSNEATLTVTPSDFTLGEISGPAEICTETTNHNYSIPTVPNAGSYSWTLPEGWEILSGSGSRSIQASPGEITGLVTLKVTVTSTCGTVKENQITINIKNRGLWTGRTNTDWFTATNWECNNIPTSEYNVVIPSGLSNYPVINSGTAKARNFSIQAGASVTIHNGSIEIYGQGQNSGIFNSANGTVIFTGAAQQTIPAGFFSNNRVKNLTLRNISGVTSSASIEVTEILKVETGSFNTGGKLNLISSEEKTALIDASGNGEIIGLVHMQRYLARAYGYKYFSSPFKETTVGDFTPYIDLTSSFPNFYRYNENRRIDSLNVDATGWEVYIGAALALNVLEGYAVNFGESNDPVTVELSGEVNTGVFSRNLLHNNRNYTKGFQLVGNPYPSPINWDSTNGWTKTNVDNGIYFFTASETDGYTGTYTSYVNGISSSDGKASNIIPSMQGFFIKVTDAEDGNYPASATLTVNNNARVNDFEQQFLRTREREQPALLRFNVGFKGAQMQDAMVLYFQSNSDMKFHRDLDAHKIINTAVAVPNLYSITSNNKKASIKSLPWPETGNYQKIPLGIKAEKAGKMFIELRDLQNLPVKLNIYLIDKELKTGQNLMEKPMYNFEVKEGEHNNRFQLLFSEEKISDPAIAFDELFSVYNNDGKVLVRLNLEPGHKGIITANTVTGQLLEVKAGYGKEQVELKAINSSGIYFINLQVNGQRISKKVLINR